MRDFNGREFVLIWHHLFILECHSVCYLVNRNTSHLIWEKGKVKMKRSQHGENSCLGFFINCWPTEIMGCMLFKFESIVPLMRTNVSIKTYNVGVWDVLENNTQFTRCDVTLDKRIRCQHFLCTYKRLPSKEYSEYKWMCQAVSVKYSIYIFVLSNI